MKGLLQNFLALWLPPTCVVCDEILEAQEKIGICGSCWGNLPWWEKDEHPSPELPKYIDSFVAPFVYEEPISEIIPALKFGDRSELAAPMARFMAELLPQSHDFILVPVPIHRNRMHGRMYNQSIELVKAIAKISGAEKDLKTLCRVKDTSPQVGKSAIARRKMSASAFKVKKDVAGKNIVLVDDVWTTGSTASACAKCLKKAGAKRVDVLTLAYVHSSIYGA